MRISDWSSDVCSSDLHELRTPLNAIIGFSEVMASEALGPIGAPRYGGYARDILDSGRHLLGVINDILDMSRIEAGSVQLEESDVAIGTVGEEIGRASGRERVCQ